jgi:hypothetical protein
MIKAQVRNRRLGVALVSYAAKYVLVAIAGIAMLLQSATARAACTTDTTATAWGPYSVFRDSSGNCHFQISQYHCVASQPTGCSTCDAHFRQPIQTVTDPAAIGAPLTGNLTTACEDLSGYDTVISNIVGIYYKPTTSGYGCDSVFTDSDQDNVGACLDKGWDGTTEVSSDNDPRKWVRTYGIPETVCDSVDNDQDGYIDGGTYQSSSANGNAFGCTTPPCSPGVVGAPDYKRLHQSNLYQGDENAKVNLVDGRLQLSAVDATIEGPYGPISFWVQIGPGTSS